MGRAANRNDVIFGVAWRGVAWRGKKLFIDRTNTNSTVPLASNDARTYIVTQTATLGTPRAHQCMRTLITL